MRAEEVATLKSRGIQLLEKAAGSPSWPALFRPFWDNKYHANRVSGKLNLHLLRQSLDERESFMRLFIWALCLFVSSSSAFADDLKTESSGNSKQIQFDGKVQDEKFSWTTGWLLPAIPLGDAARAMNRIDLELHDTLGDQAAGVIKFYKVEPKFNEFGDANLEVPGIESFSISLMKDEVKLPDSRFSARQNANQFKDRIRFRLRSQTDKQSLLSQLIFVHSTTGGFPNRLLVEFPDQDSKPIDPLSFRFDHVLELSPHGLSNAEAVVKTNFSSIELNSSTLRFPDGQQGTFRIRSNGTTGNFTWDRNSVGYSPFGDRGMSTLVGYPGHPVEFDKIDLQDLKMQGRQLFQFHANDMTFSLIVHPQIDGEHRLLFRDGDTLTAIIPLHSTQFRRWSLTKLLLEGATERERQAFELVSKTFPLFNGFRLEGNSLVSASFQSLDDSNNHVLQEIADLPNLKGISLRNCSSLGTALGRMQNLKSVNISQVNATEDLLRQIGMLDQLQVLRIDNSQLDWSAMHYLSPLTNLQSLILQSNQSLNVSDDHFDVLANFTKLETLYLHNISLSESSFKHLSTFPKLKRIMLGSDVSFKAAFQYARKHPTANFRFGSSGHIDISNSTVSLPQNVTNDNLKNMGELTGIRTLRISASDQVSDSGLASLAKNKFVEVDLQNLRQITDQGIAKLCEMKTIESLNLWYCRQITNESVQHLEKLPKLKIIKVTGTKINRDFLMKKLPDCKVQ